MVVINSGVKLHDSIKLMATECVIIAGWQQRSNLATDIVFSLVTECVIKVLFDSSVATECVITVWLDISVATECVIIVWWDISVATECAITVWSDRSVATDGVITVSEVW